MKSRSMQLWASLLLACIVSSAGTLYAQDNLTFKVLSTKIVTKVVGANGSSVTWENAESAKGMILELLVIVPKDTTLWAPDFDIAYQHENSDEDRGKCRGITTVVSSPDDEGSWIIGDYSKVTAKKGTRYVKLLFPIESDVKSFSLQFSQPMVKTVPVNRD